MFSTEKDINKTYHITHEEWTLVFNVKSKLKGSYILKVQPIRSKGKGLAWFHPLLIQLH